MYFLNLLDEELDENKLIKLFSNIYDNRICPEFSDDEIQNFNNYVKKKDINSIATMFEVKKNLSDEVFKNIIYSKTDSFWEFVMDDCYDLWDSKMNRNNFLDNLSDYEKLSVQFGNFNDQVQNGGLIQWDQNGYSDDIDDLISFLKTSDYSDKDKFIYILNYFSYIKKEVNKLDKYNDWYNEDYNTRMETLDHCDKEYCKIQGSWKEYFENYLIDNIPLKYVDKIYELDKNINY